jgi:peptidoglycan L-alanyl-D-glutamate endopeptidase CwlK
MDYSKRTLENLAGLNRKFRAKVETLLASLDGVKTKHGVTIEVISGLRSWAQQSALYAQGRTKHGKIVTMAKAGSSFHNYGLAIDFGIFKGGKYLDETNPLLATAIYRDIAKIAKEQGMEWAGDWKKFTETPHFQWTNGYTLAGLRAKMPTVNFDVQKLI